MTTMADVKAAFYDSQRQSANLFEILFADLSKLQAQAHQAKEAEASIPSPVEMFPVPA